MSATLLQESRTLLATNAPLAINGARLNSTLQHSCRWGCTKDGGMNRLALNDDDASVRRWFIEQCQALGCSITVGTFCGYYGQHRQQVDRMGNIFAVLAGIASGAPIAMGSHLDTQPTGGRYDGILGVLGGLEILRVIKESKYITRHPIAVVVWTNEEGARFIPSMLGSAVWAHDQTLEFGHSRQDSDHISVFQELQRHGFLGDVESSHKAIPLKAHFELHIEQGPILDEANIPAAAVAGVQAFRWFEIKLQGRGSHAGTTPMEYRRDPLKAFAQLILAAEEVAHEFGGLATIGRVGSHGPQSTNCILDDIVFHLDLRHHTDAILEQMAVSVQQRISTVCSQLEGVHVAYCNALTGTSSVQFDKLAVSCVQDACREYTAPLLVSGAGHDSVHTSKHCPTAMVFIRCKDGISHHPSEYSTPADIVGTQVLLDSVLAYDQKI